MSGEKTGKRKFLKKIFRGFSALATDSRTHLSLGISFLLIILMVLILAVERDSNASLNTLFDSLWYTLVTITTIGYGDITPITIPGKLIAITIMFSGVIIFGAVSGQMASILFDRQQKKDRGFLKLKNSKNHFIICGWKPDLEIILSGILRSNPDLEPSEIVLINSAKEEDLFSILSSARYSGIHFINGDFTEEDTLVRANIAKASKILILSDYSKNYSVMEMDSRTVLAVLSIESLNRKIYIGAELIDEKFRKHLESARCDEIILGKNYERKLLVSASNGTGISHVLNSLLSEEEGTGITISDINAGFIDKTFGELSDWYRDNSREILVGLLENTGNFYQRKEEALGEAQKDPDISKIVENLKKVKELKSNRTVLAPGRSYHIRKHCRAIVIGREAGAKAGGQE